MVLSRGWALFLVGVGVWTWVIWSRFAGVIWDDPRSWSTGRVGDGSPTSFLLVHAVLVGVSLAIGTTVGVLGVRGWWAGRTARTEGQGQPRPARPESDQGLDVGV